MIHVSQFASTDLPPEITVTGSGLEGTIYKPEICTITCTEADSKIEQYSSAAENFAQADLPRDLPNQTIQKSAKQALQNGSWQQLAE